MSSSIENLLFRTYMLQPQQQTELPQQQYSQQPPQTQLATDTPQRMALPQEWIDLSNV